jgi:hypothetical protein
MMAMITIARYVAMPQQIKQGLLIRENVQQNNVIGHTMLVHYASVTITNYLDERRKTNETSNRL